MKSFSQFILEARVTLASRQATQMGLQSSGHGDYYDKQGRLVAKTIKGKLNFFKGKGKGKIATADTNPVEKEITQVQPQEIESTPPTQDDTPRESQPKGIVITVGRFNPPAKGHEAILKYGLSLATQNNYEYRIYPSRVQDRGTDPLNPTLKIEFMKMMYPNFADYIMDDDNSKTILYILKALYNKNYRDVRIVVGNRRVGEFQGIVHQDPNYEFDNLEVLPAPGGDYDSDNSGKGSSIALRTAAAKGDFNAFSRNLPSSMNRNEKESLFMAVSKSINLKENLGLWEIAPELDKEGLRQNYKENNLYPIGSLVENVNTGLRGRVMRRGTNYLICVTNEGMMFKSWISSVHLAEDVYEVGTDKYRNALQQITPLHPIGSYTGVKIKETVPKNINKINKKLQK